MTDYIFSSTLGLILCVYSTGYLISAFFTRGVKPYFDVLSAVPLGLGVWSILWISLRLFQLSHDFGLSSLVNRVSILLYLIIFLIFFCHFVLVTSAKKSTFSWWVFGMLVISVFTWAYLEVSNKLFVSGDSHDFMNWASDPIIMLELGFPLISLSWTNLATFLGADQLLGVIYPLLSLSLSLLLYGAVLSYSEERFGKGGLHLVFACIAFILFVLVTHNRMFLINAHYVNHHVFMAFVLLAICHLILYSSLLDGRLKILLGLLTLLASMARMEGFLYVCMLLTMAGFSYKAEKKASSLLFIPLLMVSPYLLFLTISNWDSSFVKGWHYAIMLSMGMISILFAAGPRRLFLIAPVFHYLILIAFIFFIMITTWLKPEHMLVSLYYTVINAGNIIDWGLLTFFSLVSFCFLVYERWSAKDYWRSTDILIFWVISTCFLIFVLSYLRYPREGWSDSGNRMLFHVFPVMLLWVGIELVELVRRRGLKHGSATYVG